MENQTEILYHLACLGFNEKKFIKKFDLNEIAIPEVYKKKNY